MKRETYINKIYRSSARAIAVEIIQSRARRDYPGDAAAEGLFTLTKEEEEDILQSVGPRQLEEIEACLFISERYEEQREFLYSLLLHLSYLAERLNKLLQVWEAEEKLSSLANTLLESIDKGNAPEAFREELRGIIEARFPAIIPEIEKIFVSGEKMEIGEEALFKEIDKEARLFALSLEKAKGLETAIEEAAKARKAEDLIPASITDILAEYRKDFCFSPKYSRSFLLKLQRSQESEKAALLEKYAKFPAYEEAGINWEYYTDLIETICR